MVEGGKIDHAAHDNRAKLTITELLAFDDAVKVAIEARASANDTLIVVSADHETGGLAINGYGDIEIKGDELFTVEPPDGGDHIISFASGPGSDRSKDLPAKDDPSYRR